MDTRTATELWEKLVERDDTAVPALNVACDGYPELLTALEEVYEWVLCIESFRYHTTPPFNKRGARLLLYKALAHERKRLLDAQ